MKFRIKCIEENDSFKVSHYYEVAIAGVFWGWNDLDDNGYEEGEYSSGVRVPTRDLALRIIDLYLKKHPKRHIKEIEYITKG